MRLRLIIIFLCVYVLTLIAFLPLRYALMLVDLPPSVHIDIEGGSIWKGHGHIRVDIANKPLAFDVSWRTCLSRQFPFYSNCLTLSDKGIKLAGRLIGIPREQLSAQSIVGRADMVFLSDFLGRDAPLITFVNPQGKLNLELSKLRYSIEENRLLAWEGTVALADIHFFNVKIPDVVGQLTQEPFISKQAREVLFSDQDLPTMRFGGGDRKLGIVSQGQFLPDRQIKLSAELTVFDNSLRPVIQAFSTHREGNKYFWEYQGSYDLAKNFLRD